MYTCNVDDAIADAVKQAAYEQNRSIRRQFISYIIIGLKSEGRWPLNETNKKADCIRQDNQSATDTQQTTEE